MASAMECESVSMNKYFLLKKDEELELSLDLSLGGTMGKSKDKKTENPCLKKYPSGNMQPCLRKFASGSFDDFVEDSKRNIGGIDNDSGRKEIWTNLHVDKPSTGAGVTSGPLPLSRSQSGADTFEEMKPFVLSNGSGGKPAWPHHFVNTSAPNNTMVQNGTGHPRILRTCSVGAVGAGFMVPSPSSVLHRQPSIDVLMPDRNQEGVQSTRQKEALEQQRKREMHAMRRQEARKKREEKKARRDEGKSLGSVSFPVSSGAILSGNKWMLNPELPTNTQTSQNEMDRKEGISKAKSKSPLETQRSLKRERDMVSKEVEPWIEKEKMVKRKKSGNGGSMDPLPSDFDIDTKVGVANQTESSKLIGANINGNCSARKSSSPGRGNATRNANSPGRGNSGSEEKNSINLYENGHKSSSSNVEDCESAVSRSQTTNCEASPSASTSASAPYTSLSYPVLPITYPYAMASANGQCMPLPIGLTFPYMMPYWTHAIQPTGSEPPKSNVPHMPNIIQPVSAFGLSPSQMPIHGTLPSWLSMPQAKGTAASVQNSHSSGGSLARSSSIPDKDRKSSEGSSSVDTKSQSIKSDKGFEPLTRFPSVSKAEGQSLSNSEVTASHKAEHMQLREAAEKIPYSSSQSDFEIASSKTSQEKTLDTSSKKPTHFVSSSNEKKQNSSCHSVPDNISEAGQTKQTQNCKYETQDQDDNSNSKPVRSSQLDNGMLQTFHRVTTTGVGPKGITISGILSYNSNQVRIVCICHGKHMSPAEFVQHAGSTDISNPERNIVVTPTPFIIPATSARG